MPEDIQLWPPDAHPLIGRSAVSAEMARATTRIHYGASDNENSIVVFEVQTKSLT
jgi:hypothetical protein